MTGSHRLVEPSSLDRDTADPTFVKKATKHKRRRADGRKGSQRSGTGGTNISGTRERTDSINEEGSRGRGSSSSHPAQREIVDLVVESDLDNRKSAQNPQQSAYSQ